MFILYRLQYDCITTPVYYSDTVCSFKSLIQNRSKYNKIMLSLESQPDGESYCLV